ncbi:hypothetical protein EUA93_08480 [Nocardioides oleivorans]|uniref:Uncharacterized protein n=1 Tax=Nocardioides oleivorans TaxID=273676 RepID=A0A4Q2RZS0_9ACTN|nr:hypothetical protein [Nocardioides oleivorans]RYB94376.1 hypothetical protein EUA93_08480 [Nocardioides oleivorans]
MRDLVLVRSADDRRRYDIEGVGSLRRVGLFSRTTLLLPDGDEPLTAQSRVSLSGQAEAVAAGGDVVGEFSEQTLLGHGGEVVWRGRKLRLESGTVLISRYVLRDGRTRLLEVQARGWGDKPADVTLGDEPVDPGLVLFVLWLAQGFVDHDSGTGVATAAAT